jgi:cytochrome c peroxidase
LPLSPHAKHGLSASAQRGKALFFSSETRCAECHCGPLFTDSNVKSRPMHDVGTGEGDPSEKLGPKYDTPTLLGVYRTGPYLHHGQAATLADVLTTKNPDDRHGRTSHLSPSQIDDLVEFLKSLPYEDPEAAAAAAGSAKIER